MSITVIDTETTGVDPYQEEILETAVCFPDGNTWDYKSELYDVTRSIPPEASAEHGITNRMVRDHKTFAERVISDPGGFLDFIRLNETEYYVAHNAEYDMKVLQSNLSVLDLENVYSSDDLSNLVDLIGDTSKWICTLRLAKHIYNDEYLNFVNFKMQYLRYKLELDVPDDMQAHRGGPDTFVCAKLYENLCAEAEKKKLVDDSSDPAQMHQLCWSSIYIPTFPFGKYKGDPISNTPTDYFQWAYNKLDVLDPSSYNYNWDLDQTIQSVLTKRGIL